MANVLTLRSKLMFMGIYAAIAVGITIMGYVKSKREDVAKLVAAVPQQTLVTVPVAATPVHSSAHSGAVVPKLIILADKPVGIAKASFAILKWNAREVPAKSHAGIDEVVLKDHEVELHSLGEKAKAFSFPFEEYQMDGGDVACPQADEHTCVSAQWSASTSEYGKVVRATIKAADTSGKGALDRVYFYPTTTAKIPFFILEVKS